MNRNRRSLFCISALCVSFGIVNIAPVHLRANIVFTDAELKGFANQVNITVDPVGDGTPYRGGDVQQWIRHVDSERADYLARSKERSKSEVENRFYFGLKQALESNELSDLQKIVLKYYLYSSKRPMIVYEYTRNPARIGQLGYHPTANRINLTSNHSSPKILIHELAHALAKNIGPDLGYFEIEGSKFMQAVRILANEVVALLVENGSPDSFRFSNAILSRYHATQSIVIESLPEFAPSVTNQRSPRRYNTDFEQVASLFVRAVGKNQLPWMTDWQRDIVYHYSTAPGVNLIGRQIVHDLEARILDYGKNILGLDLSPDSIRKIDKWEKWKEDRTRYKNNPVRSAVLKCLGLASFADFP